MNIGPIVDVAIGMVFIYFLLALIASGIQEFVAGVFTWRGTYLRRAMDVILSNDTNAQFGWNAKDFLVAHLTSKAPPLRPAATPPPNPAPAQIKLAEIPAVPEHPTLSGVPNKLPSYIPSRGFAKALLETLRDGSDSPLFAQVKQTVGTLPNGDLKKTLSLFVNDAGNDVDAFRKNVEQWFDDAMDRVNGIYSRLSQYFLLILGLTMAVVLNVNSFDIAETLWQSPALTQSIVTQATQAASDPSSLPCPAPDTTTTPDAKTATGCSDAQKLAAANDANVKSLQIPIGWSKWPDGLHGWLSCICGLVVTACAIGLGAPFWFGLLQNLTNFRNAGPAPKREDAKPS